MIHVIPTDTSITITSSPNGWVIADTDTEPSTTLIVTSSDNPPTSPGFTAQPAVITRADSVTIAASGRTLTLTTDNVTMNILGGIRLVGGIRPTEVPDALV